MASVSRRDRQIDLAALLLILCGAALFLVARAQMQAIPTQYSWQKPGPAGAVAVVDRTRHVAEAGAALVVAGCVVGLVSAVRHVARRRRERASV